MSETAEPRTGPTPEEVAELVRIIREEHTLVDGFLVMGADQSPCGHEAHCAIGAVLARHGFTHGMLLLVPWTPKSWPFMAIGLVGDKSVAERALRVFYDRYGMDVQDANTIMDANDDAMGGPHHRSTDAAMRARRQRVIDTIEAIAEDRRVRETPEEAVARERMQIEIARDWMETELERAKSTLSDEGE